MYKYSERVVKNPRVSIGAEIRENSKPHFSPIAALVRKFEKIVISVADPDPGSGSFLTPGSGIGKKSGSGPGMNNLDHIF